MDSTRPVTAAEKDARTFDSIAAEHHFLSKALENLAGSRDPGQALSRLEELRGLLERHYAGEEADDGLPRLIGANAPHLIESLQRIFDEHRQFLSDLEQLAAEARALVDKNVELQRDIAGFVERMRDHERRETALVSDAINTDLGPGD